MEPQHRLVIGATALALVGLPAAWLATVWALSQATAVSTAGHPAEGWVLALRPVLIPLGMVITWTGVRRSGTRGWTLAVRVLGSGALLSVVLLFLDGVLSGGFLACPTSG